MLKYTAIILCFLTVLSTASRADTPAYYLSASDRLVVKAHEALDKEELFLALTTFEKAIVSNPKNIKGYHGLGQAHSALKNHDLALKYLDTGLLMEPSSLALLKDKGLVLLDLDDESAAKDVLDKMRFICGETPCKQGDELESALTTALQKKVAEIQPE